MCGIASGGFKDNDWAGNTSFEGWVSQTCRLSIGSWGYQIIDESGRIDHKHFRAGDDVVDAIMHPFTMPDITSDMSCREGAIMVALAPLSSSQNSGVLLSTSEGDSVMGRSDLAAKHGE